MSHRKRKAQERDAKRRQTDRRHHADPVEAERANAQHQRVFHSRITTFVAWGTTYPINSPRGFYLRHLGLGDRCAMDPKAPEPGELPAVIRTRRNV